MQSNTGENLQEDDQQSTCEIPCSLPDKRPCRDPLKGDEPPPHSCNVGLVGNRVIVGTSWSRMGPVRKEASRLPCLEEPFSVEQVQTCWASSLLRRGWTCLWHWKIFEGIIFGLLSERGKMVKVSPVELMQLLLLQAHTFLISHHLFFVPPPLPFIFQVSVFSCSFFLLFDVCHSPFGFCCCPYSLKTLWRQFFPLFQNVLIFSSVSYSISSWTKKMSRKRKWTWLSQTF